MAKIVDYTLDTMLDMQEKYCDMVDQIETRALEIAKAMGVVDSTYIVNDVDVGGFDGHNIYVHACFIQMGLAEDDDEPLVQNYKFPVDWLFNDDYLNHIPPKTNNRSPQEDKEYQEYLRLKKKFEGA